MPCHPSVVLLRPLLLCYLQRVCPSNIPGKRGHAVMPAERGEMNAAVIWHGEVMQRCASAVPRWVS